MKFRNLFLAMTLLMGSFTIMAVTGKKNKPKKFPLLAVSEKKLLAIENMNSSGQTARFNYDAAGNLRLVEWDETKTEYSYVSDSMMAFTSNKRKNRRTEFFRGHFSEAGYLNGYERWYILSGDTMRSFGKFEYNEQGFLEQQKIRFNNGDEWQKIYSYDQNDLVSVKVFKNNKPVSTTIWEYTDKADPVRIDFSRFFDAALNITGAASKHLPSRKLVLDPKAVTQLDEYYTYEFDANGFVTKRTTKSATSAFQTIEEKFVYDR
jgi:YD repeat-containing protein